MDLLFSSDEGDSSGEQDDFFEKKQRPKTKSLIERIFTKDCNEEEVLN